jgi:hypothetical protein
MWWFTVRRRRRFRADTPRGGPTVKIVWIVTHAMNTGTDIVFVSRRKRNDL